MKRHLLATFNTGSSSLKISVYEVSAGVLRPRCLTGSIRDIGRNMRVDLTGATEAQSDVLKAGIKATAPNPRDMISAWLAAMPSAFPGAELIAVGHRIVHGGMRTGPELATPETLESLSQLSCFAPGHQPHNLAGVAAVAEAHPALLQSLSFDTAFHRTQPRAAELYGLPLEYADKGLIRYGFHGLSYAHMSACLPELFEGKPHARVIGLHLGSGASLCGLKDGKSIGASMGLTALSGIIMSSRCGDLDPGAVLHLIEHEGLSVDEVSDLLNHRSGLLGLSGESPDIRDLLASSREEAATAMDVYIHRIVREIGALMTTLGGLDGLVFTGGVGENSPEIRGRICKQLEWMGLRISAAYNESGANILSTPSSEVVIATLPADEEAVIARETVRTYTRASPPQRTAAYRNYNRPSR